MKAKHLLLAMLLCLPLLWAVGCSDDDDEGGNNPAVVCQINGVVNDEAGDPVAGATVTMEGVTVTLTGTATTNAQGQYTLDARDDQTFRLRAVKDDMDCAWVTVAVTDCPQTVAALVIAEPEPCLITGVVEDEDGQPVAGAEVVLEGVSVVADETATTDALGEFEITARDGETFRLRATSAPLISDWVEVTVSGCPFAMTAPLVVMPPPSGSVSGIVSNTWGGYLSGVLVVAGSVETTTNESGYFVLTGVTAGDVMVAFVLDGYVTTFENATVIADQTTHLADIRLMQAESHALDGVTGGDIETLNGVGGLTFPANAFVDENGDPYTDEVNVEVAAVQPTDPNFYDVFPGDFEGVREDGSTVMFVSFGFMDVNFTNADKSAPVRLAPGATAELRMDVAEELKAMAPATIPMWYYDSDTGRWIEDGSAELVDDTYVTDVDHFTTWNWDLPLDEVCQIQGQVTDPNGDPIMGARVISSGVQTAIMDEAYTDVNGNYSVRGIVGETFRVRAISGSYASEVIEITLTECPYTVDTVLQVLEPAFSISLVWGVNPWDLDSHLLIPASWQDPPYSPFHLYYGNMGDLTAAPFTQLDTDDTSSYGPEIISGFNFYPGTYSYYIHHYSGYETIATSGAVVTLEIDGQTRTYLAANATGSGDTRYWHVFDFTYDTVEGITITDVMQWGTPSAAKSLTVAPKH